jgi:DNA polymerase
MLVGPFLVGDFAQIEARLLSWFAEDAKMLEVFRQGLDPYKVMAASIYHLEDIEEVTPSQRFMGKQTVLGCGYRLGWEAFQRMLDVTYDTQIGDEEAQSIVTAYRRSAPAVVRLWNKLQRAMQVGISNKGTLIEIVKGGRLAIKFVDLDTFYLRLPSGRKLWYYDVRRDGKSWLAYGRNNVTHQMGEVYLHGGILTGHIVQSTARDVMAEALERLEAERFAPVLTVHDEAVSGRVSRGFDRFADLMSVCPQWLTDFPMKAECYETPRYRK